MRQAHSFGAEGVVLRHMDYGEADRLITVYTSQSGKIRALVKGARKITSRKAGHLEPFTRVRLQLARRHDLPLVTQADTVDAYPALHDDLMLTGHASYVVELLDRFAYEEGTESGAVFQLLTETLNRLSANSDTWVAIRYYEIRLLDHLGFRPKLFECAHCGKEILPENQFFSYSAGGVICPASARTETALKPISMEGLKYLRHFQRSTFQQASRANAAGDTQSEIETLMHGYFTYLLERELKTPGFIREIQRRQQGGGADSS
jgi:DNA repair protein RecO (recombination protein O)